MKWASRQWVTMLALPLWNSLDRKDIWMKWSLMDFISYCTIEVIKHYDQDCLWNKVFNRACDSRGLESRVHNDKVKGMMTAGMGSAWGPTSESISRKQKKTLGILQVFWNHSLIKATPPDPFQTVPPIGS